MALKYKIISGALPYGVTLDSNTGYLRGIPDFSNIEAGPQWVTPAGSLGTFTALSDVTIPALQVNPQGSATKVIAVNLIVPDGSQGIPWGLTFNPDTWVISGTLAEQKTNDPISQFTDDELPVWNTEDGSLGTYGELSTVSIKLSATAEASHTISSYYLIDGALPWGLMMNSDGTITGTTAELKVSNLSEYVPPAPVPTWNTPLGLLGTGFVGDKSSLSISATPNLGKTISYFVLNGALPWGLSLNTDGTITGTYAELKSYQLPVLPDAPKWPTNTTTIGSYSLAGNLSVNYQVPAPVLTSGATLTGMYITGNSNAMPMGLSISSTGLITGTISKASNAVGTSTFSVFAIDSNNMVSSGKFQITITA